MTLPNTTTKKNHLLYSFFKYTRLREIACDAANGDVNKRSLQATVNYIFKSPEEASNFTG